MPLEDTLLGEVLYWLTPKVVMTGVMAAWLCGVLYSCKEPQKWSGLIHNEEPAVVQQHEEKKLTFGEYARTQRQYSTEFPVIK